MNSAIGRNIPRDDIIKKGEASIRTGKFGVQHECQLVLRGYVAPFRLEVYSCGSGVGKVYSLENVKRVKYCSPVERNVSLKIQFCDSPCLYFTFISEREAEEWREGIQMHSLARPKHTTLTNLKSHVILMPNSNCHLNGSYALDVTDDAIRISDAHGATPRIVWPVHTIRFYGYRRKIFSIATASRSETGEGLFHLEALSAKKSEFIYDCVAALVSRMLKVAAAAAALPVPRSLAPHLPGSVTTQISPSILPSDSIVYRRNDGKSVSNPASGSNSTSLDDTETFVLNSFYLKRMGMSVDKPTKAPEIYGLGRSKRDLLEAFTSAREPPERFTGGAILYGPSNCGKRLLVEAVAVHQRATLLCFPAKCLQQLDREPGGGVQLLFNVAMAQAPCIVLIKHLEDMLPSSPSSSLSTDEVDSALRVFQKVEDAFLGPKKLRGISFVGTISDLTKFDLALPSYRWMNRKIYVPPPSLDTRRQVFASELRDLLGSGYLDRLAQKTAGFNFVQLIDLYGDIKKVAVSDALDHEGQSGLCDMKIIDMSGVKRVLKESESERRSVYEESGLSSARYHAMLNSSREAALFVIKLVVNEALPGVSHCFLRISDSSVDLRDLDPTQMIMSWQLTSIRRHTWTPLSLVLEIGRNSQTKAGEFHFDTIEARTIWDLLDKILREKKIKRDEAR